MKNFIQTGDTIQYTAGADIASGAIIKVGSLIGVAATAIPNGATGSVKLTGVFSVPAASGIATGDKVFWDQSLDTGKGQFAKDTGTGYASGDNRDSGTVALTDSANGTCLVRFAGLPGIVGA